ncbi:gliding motility-associated ABC transporter substrate-binding protein GldG [Flavimarina sp. Hel_I_48]|uniref:gliding motility-associated ABC transporter substrate-binding protein GldG n=1 Tax=Flavimarina sp. Hel_I_48 TaxID=1392488 RepID=UPI0004DF5C60|nr:gliding motility-associated ABC transporter substrate-binding protein GldG [Flavimarina sp. Hel_I_48]
MKAPQNIKALALGLILFVGINWLASYFYTRWDLTQDGRYTLSETSENILKKAEKPLIIDVFLAGEFPPAFRKLQSETRQLLEEYAAVNPNVRFEFIDPVPENTSAEKVAQQFNQRGMRPEQVQVRENGKVSQELVFPWATASYEGKSVKIPLLKKALGASPDELVSRSTQNLEYELSNAFYKLLNPKSKRIAVLKGNGELDDRYIADFFSTLRERYFLAPFPLDSIESAPDDTFKALQKFDLVVVAKPTEAFTDVQKYALDQYTMSGGKSLWLLDNVAMETDSLYKNNGTAVALNRNLNLSDMFFKYGIRINPVLVEDLYAAPIVLATGDGNNSNYQQLPWFYFPLVTSDEQHPINSNLDNPIRFEYANQIDLLDNGIAKTVLLHSSNLTKLKGTPTPISLEEVSLEPNPAEYTAGPQNMAVLLEGNFVSAFQNRVLPLEINGEPFRESAAKRTKMIIIADGDLIKNDLDQQGRPLELGFNKFTYDTYGNKEFLLNAANYLLDDNGLINIRSKTVLLPALDMQRAINERSTWQVLVLVLPLVILGLFAAVFLFLRKRSYR